MNEAPQTKTDYAAIEERALAHAAEERTVGQELSKANKALHEIDALVIAADSDPEMQLGILIMACVLATRRVCAKAMIFDRGRRMRIVKGVVSQFDRKMRRYIHMGS